MKKLSVLLTLIIVSTMILASCAPAEPEIVEVEKIVEKEVEVEKIVEKEVEVEKIVEVEAVSAADQAKEFLAGKKICSVFPGPVNDAGWTTSAYMGLINLRDNFGMETAYREHALPEETEDIMREYAEAGCDAIHAHGFEYFDQINAVAAEYPDIQFLQTSRCFGQEPNVIGLCYSAGEGGYFVGRLAALITKSGKIAWIVGQSYPNLSWNPIQAEVAIADLGSDAIVNEVEVGSWNDPAKAKEMTAALIEQDYDVFVLVSDASDIGAVEAVREAREAGNEDVIIISWVKDKNYLGPEFIIGGWEEMSYKQMEYAMLTFAEAGEPVAADMPLGVDEGVSKLNPMYGLVTPEVEKDVMDLYFGYFEDKSTIPNIEVRKDL